jgi:hypothetical protein
MNEELCDEEKSYNEWVINNLYYIRDHKDCIKVMQKLYIAGFAAGFVHRDKINYMNQLQK